MVVLAIVPVLLLALVTQTTSAVHVEILNHCDGAMKLFDGVNVTRLEPNASIAYDLPPKSIRAYRYDTGTQATLAEFSIDVGNRTWYDISIIPTGPLGGPKMCASLDECKALTGGVGFNKPMQITPNVNYPDVNCRQLVCLQDGCDDAYQFPQQNEKTHSCPAVVAFQVIFCPSSHDVETGWYDKPSVLESGVIVGDTAALVTPVPTAPADSAVSTRSSEDESSSTAVYVAVVLGGVVVLIVAAVALVRYRQRVVANAQSQWSLDRKSSAVISFVSARDAI